MEKKDYVLGDEVKCYLNESCENGIIVDINNYGSSHIYDVVLDNYLFQDGAEKLLSDIEHIAIAMKAPRIHKMGYA